MSNRSERIRVANHTLKILEKGYYYTSSRITVNIKQELSYAIKNTILYKPEDLKKVNNIRDLLNKRKKRIQKTIIKVVNKSTLSAAKAITKEGKFDNVSCLNFASAKNPGGGFLKGSQAQEESLARASGLYPCIAQMKEMYEANKKFRSGLYLDYIIYSPRVPVFRDDITSSLLKNPYFISVITAPAVNAGVVKKREKNQINNIKKIMINRIEKILSIALLNGVDAIILGAWGCGVFKNEPKEVVNYFNHHLAKGKFSRVFKKVIFAVLDNTPKRKFITPFRKEFLE